MFFSFAYFSFFSSILLDSIGWCLKYFIDYDFIVHFNLIRYKWYDQPNKFCYRSEIATMTDALKIVRRVFLPFFIPNWLIWAIHLIDWICNLYVRDLNKLIKSNKMPLRKKLSEDILYKMYIIFVYVSFPLYWKYRRTIFTFVKCWKFLLFVQVVIHFLPSTALFYFNASGLPVFLANRMDESEQGFKKQINNFMSLVCALLWANFIQRWKN